MKGIRSADAARLALQSADVRLHVQIRSQLMNLSEVWPTTIVTAAVLFKGMTVNNNNNNNHFLRFRPELVLIFLLVTVTLTPLLCHYRYKNL